MRDKSYYVSRAKEIIDKIHYLTLATTSSDNIPWNSPVAYSVDSRFNFYFGSPKYTQHSQNIRANNKAFVVIYDSTAPDGEGEGVYIQATVRELEQEAEIRDALEVMFKGDQQYSVANFSGESDLRTYTIEPDLIWMNDAEEKDGLYFDYRVEISLTD